ncbi:transcription elongation factor Spt5 [Piromyces finnis]|uniref:Transcription elongation factor SPT5 n=1 Tax=Piromyces finnis TaxID=1754191 RepID=A0A1Y1V0P6_9FUNG|nr:transcription elongation factor Spt5 [Piromyces finnis]|eukprot:ORX44147.1 transcription elongation factor Spt5 [Piromyces finnis]
MSDSERENYSDEEIEHNSKLKQEDDYDEDDDYDEEYESRSARNMFIDTEAAVDDEEEEEEEEDYDRKEAEAAASIEKSYLDERSHRQLDRSRQYQDEMDAEELAEQFKQRYASQSHGFRGNVDHVPQNLLMPDPGKERDIVFNMMRKYFDMEYSEHPVQILSIFTRDNLKGYLYIESESKAFVQKAIEQTNNVYMSRMTLVPIQEMTDVLTIRSKEAEIKPGSWARVKRGKYQGDLCQIIEITESTDAVRVKIIPRLELKKKGLLDNKKRKKEEGRPPQKLFNPNDVDKSDHNLSKSKGYWIYGSDMFNKDGYLEKEMKIISLDTNNINPTLDEITKFTGGAIGENQTDLAELSITSGTAVASTEDFFVGEHVEVTEGELINLHGIVKSVDNDIVSIIPADSEELDTGVLTFAANQLRKRFLEGDHVKVINGKHKDETGLVLKIVGTIITVLSDLTLKEIVVFSKDLKAAAEITSTIATIGPYDIHDLVQIGYNNVGVIIKIERDMCKVLDNYGQVQTISSKNLGQKHNRKGLASDAYGNTISPGDTVQTTDSQKRKAVILHVYRGLAFLYSREYPENEGVFYEKTDNILLVNGKNMKDDDGFSKPFGSYSRKNFQNRNNNNNNRRNNIRGRGGRRGRDNLLGRTVTLTKGPFKGYLGIVKDCSGDMVRVELHTNSKVITAPRDEVHEQGENYSNQNYSHGGYSGRISDGGRTPMYSGAKTPRTPSYRYDGSKTPSYRYDGSTPNPYSDGSKTPAWDAGSRTPGYNMGSKTPAWDADSSANSRNSYGQSSYSNSESGTSNYAQIPATPAYGAADVETPYNPATPAPFTPSIPQTPGIPSTPGPLYPNTGSVRPTTPFTPADYTPGTQFTNPATPFMPTGGDYALSNVDDLLPTATDDWATEEIEVVIVPKNGEEFNFGVYNNQHGVIEKVDKHHCQVILDQNNSNITIPTKFLEPVCPDQKKQQVKVIIGKNRNQIGNLHSIDGNDGIVRMVNASDIKCMNLKALAKYRPKS